MYFVLIPRTFSLDGPEVSNIQCTSVYNNQIKWDDDSMIIYGYIRLQNVKYQNYPTLL